MRNPRHYLYLMFTCLAVVGVICTLLYGSLKSAFLANWGFNLLILCALGTGIGINMFHVLRLEPELEWMNIFRTGQLGRSVAEESPVLLKPLIKHLSGVHRDRFKLSALSLRTVLEGIRAHLDESREISRYMIGLLIFLGLLGTFWGLLGTIGAVGQVVGGLNVGTSDFAMTFESLKAGLQEPLKGMGTAFSSSLFGLSGSLVVGFLDLQAGHAQNRFFNDMEEWLSGVTQLIDSSDDAEINEMTNSSGMARIEKNLKSLIKEIRNNQQSLEQLIEIQKNQNNLEKKQK